MFRNSDQQTMQNMKKITVAVLAASLCGTVVAAEQIKDSYHPSVNGSPITLMKDNLITQQLGGRWLDVDVWAGDFVKFDDNLFGNTAKEDDIINSVAAGFKAEGSDAEAWELRLEGQIQHNDYKNFSEFDGEEGYFRANGKLNLSPALSLNGGLSYDSTLDNDYGANNVNDLYRVNKIGATAGVTVKPTEYLGVDVNYGYFNQRRDDVTELQDYDENSLSARVYHSYSDNLTVYTQANYAKAEPKGKNLHPTTDSYAGNLGLAWRYMDAASAFAEIGVKYMDFDIEQGWADQTSDVTRATFHAGTNFDLNADWKLRANFAWGPSVGSMSSSSTASNYNDQVALSASAMYSPGEGRLTVKASPYYNLTDPSNNEKYTETGMALGVSYSVTDMLNVSAGYRYSYTNYDVSSDFSRNIVTLGVAGTF